MLFQQLEKQSFLLFTKRNFFLIGWLIALLIFLVKNLLFLKRVA